MLCESFFPDLIQFLGVFGEEIGTQLFLFSWIYMLCCSSATTIEMSRLRPII